MILKERFRKALLKKARRGFSGYPVATVAFYGPDDKVATKVSVGIVAGDDEPPVALERWFSEKGDVRNDYLIMQQILEFIQSQHSKSVVMTDRIIGCPHERGRTIQTARNAPAARFGRAATGGLAASSNEQLGS